MALTLSPSVFVQFCDANGAPYAGYKLFTYAAGTTTKQTTYSDSAGSVANSNPITLDSAGRPGAIYLTATAYKFVLASSTDTDPPAAAILTQDNISAVPPTDVDLDVTGTAGVALTANDAVYCSAGDGGLTAGRWYKADADQTYSSTAAYALGFATVDISSGSSGTIRISGRLTGLAGLSAGSLYYLSATAGSITSSAPTNARAVGFADTTTTLVISPWLVGPSATATIPGWVSTAAQTFGGVKTFGSPPVFTTAGAGTASIGGRLTSLYSNVGNVGGGEDDLMSFSLPAGTLSTDGMSIRVLAWGTTANTANAKTINAYFGASRVLAGSGVSLSVSEDGVWVFGFQVLRTGAATQRTVGQIVCGPGASQSTVSVGGAANAAETLSGAVTIKLTGTATSDNDIVQTGMVVMLVC